MFAAFAYDAKMPCWLCVLDEEGTYGGTCIFPLVIALLRSDRLPRRERKRKRERERERERERGREVWDSKPRFELSRAQRSHFEGSFSPSKSHSFPIHHLFFRSSHSFHSVQNTCGIFFTTVSIRMWGICHEKYVNQHCCESRHHRFFYHGLGLTNEVLVALKDAGYKFPCMSWDHWFRRKRLLFGSHAATTTSWAEWGSLEE